MPERNLTAEEAEDERVRQKLGLSFSRVTFAEVVDQALTPLDAARLYVTCNLNHLRVLQENEPFRRAYQAAYQVTIDGRPVQRLAAARAGVTFDLITGADLFPAILDRLRSGVDQPFFVCSSHELGAALRDKLRNRGFAIEVDQYIAPPFGFEKDAAAGEQLLERIRANGTTHLFFGLGAPKSEVWVSQHLSVLPPCHIFCFGAALEFAVGLKRRAPRYVRALHVEWIHRVLSEPLRLGKRYFLDAAFFARIMIGRKQLCRIR